MLCMRLIAVHRGTITIALSVHTVFPRREPYGPLITAYIASCAIS